MNKNNLIARLQTRLDALCADVDVMERGFDRDVMMGRVSELLETMVTIIETKEEI